MIILNIVLNFEGKVAVQTPRLFLTHTIMIMKKQFLLLMILVTGIQCIAQTWRVGDKVQVRTSSMDKWDNATIFLVLTDRTPTAYKAKMDVPGKYADDYPLVSASQVRSASAKPTSSFAVNSRVDLLYPDGSPHTRGSIIEIMPDGRYKVAIDGCSHKWDETVDWNQVKAAPYIASTHPDIAALIGKWAMFTPSYPNTVVKGNDVYRQYGSGAKAPPMQINANGTYTWYMEFNKPPITGRWVTDAKVDGLTSGVESLNGIIIASAISYYKIYRDRPDHIICERLCWGTTDMGSRIK